MSDSLQPYEPQHARPPCPSPTPGVHPNPCPLSRWCHPTISSSVVPFSSCPQSFPASGSFPMSQLFASGGQNIGVSASTSVLPMNTQDWSPLGWTGGISLQSILKEMGIPDHLTCFLRNLYAGQEATVRTGHGKGVCQGCILSPYLFNLYAEYIRRNAGLEEAQTGIKIAGRNINNLRYADQLFYLHETSRSCINPLYPQRKASL